MQATKTTNNITLGNLCIEPICGESFGVRSFCFKVDSPDLKIMLDPGCSLGFRHKYRIPHPKEFVQLKKFTKKIVTFSEECDMMFISHYHHDHFKPFLKDNFLISSNIDLCKQIYKNKIIFVKNIKNNINFNQRRRGKKFFHDIQDYTNSKLIRIGIDLKMDNITPAMKEQYSDNEFEETNNLEFKILSIFKKEASNLLQTIYRKGNTLLLFPKDFLHGYHEKKSIFVQPLIIIHKTDVFYFFPDVQGFPVTNDLCDLFLIKDLIKKAQQEFFSKERLTELIAFGGPITYIFKSRPKKLQWIEETAIPNSQAVVREFQNSIIDHHILRDNEFPKYWERFTLASKINKTSLNPMNPNLAKIPVLMDKIRDDKKIFDIPIMECYRRILYEIEPPTEKFKRWTYQAEHHETEKEPPN